MGEDGVSLLLKQFTQQVLDQVKDQGEHISELLRSVDKISGKQDQIEEKLDAGQIRFEVHEKVHGDLGRRVNILETDKSVRESAQKDRDRLANGVWFLIGTAVTAFVSNLPSWFSHK